MNILKTKCVRHHLHRVLLLEHKHIRCENFFRMYKMNCNQDLEVCPTKKSSQGRLPGNSLIGFIFRFIFDPHAKG